MSSKYLYHYCVLGELNCKMKYYSALLEGDEKIDSPSTYNDAREAMAESSGFEDGAFAVISLTLLSESTCDEDDNDATEETLP